MKFNPNPLLYGASGDFLSTFRLAIRMKDCLAFFQTESAAEPSYPPTVTRQSTLGSRDF